MKSKILQNPDKESQKAAVASFHTIKGHVIQMHHIATRNLFTKIFTCIYMRSCYKLA